MLNFKHIQQRCPGLSPKIPFITHSITYVQQLLFSSKQLDKSDRKNKLLKNIAAESTKNIQRAAFESLQYDANAITSTQWFETRRPELEKVISSDQTLRNAQFAMKYSLPSDPKKRIQALQTRLLKTNPIPASKIDNGSLHSKQSLDSCACHDPAEHSHVIASLAEIEKPIPATTSPTFKINAKPIKDFSSVNLVYYHGRCSDGAAAAAAAYKLLGDKAEYIPVFPSSRVDIGLIGGKNVVALDISFSEEVTKNILQHAAAYCVIDHHVTALGELENIPEEYKIIDLKQCGAALAWSTFHPDKPMPELIKYVQARDLWEMGSMQDGYIVGAALQAITTSPQQYTKLLQLEEKKGSSVLLAFLLQKGLDVQASIQAQCLEASSSAVLGKFRDWGIPVLIIHSHYLRSDLGNYLLNEFPSAEICAMFSYPVKSKPNLMSVSLRSRKSLVNTQKPASDNTSLIERFGMLDGLIKTDTEGEVVDTSMISKHFGGGGHMNASHFMTSLRFEEVFHSQTVPELVAIKGIQVADIDDEI